MSKSHGRAGSDGKLGIEGGINITSLMDILTILLLYLIMNYSAEGNILTNADNLTLPNSYAKKKATEVVLQIAVDNDMVTVDNKPIVPTKDVKKAAPQALDQSVSQLEAVLKQHYAKEEEMVRIGATNKVEGKVIIQIDKNMDFDVMYKIMQTCGKVGYNNMNFAVMERSTAEEDAVGFKLFGSAE